MNVIEQPLILTTTLNATGQSILTLFHDNVVFKLTGADVIENDFTEEGTFSLLFKDRGRIFGSFVLISVSEVILDWHVEGFNLPDEQSLVHITFSENGNQCEVNLQHKNIPNKESFDAKQRAWTEILSNLKNILS